MRLNEAVIDHHRSEIIPTSCLKKQVSLNEKYLKEKPTWYMVDGKLQYFKIRSDFRLFTEQFFSKFGKQILGLDTLDYTVAYMRTIIPGEKTTEEKAKCGLLSENFQTSGFNYYLVSELMNAEISDFISYGGYTLKNLLEYFRYALITEDYTKNEEFLIKLFIADAFMHQEDRNYHNIGFKIPKIKGVPYTSRLHPDQLENIPAARKHIHITDDNVQLIGLSPTKVYDNERILGVDHKNVLNYTPGQVWCPLFPYDEDTLFKGQYDAQEVSEVYDGMDPNLYELFTHYPSVCKPLFERLAYDDEYRRILEDFTKETSQICLSPKEIEKFTEIIEDKRKVFTRILKNN